MIIGIITNALYAKFATEVKQIEEQVQLKQIMSDSSYTGSINDLLGFDSDYNNKLIVQEGNLVYVSDEVSSQEEKWFEKLGIEEASDYFTVEFDSAGGTKISSQIIKAGLQVKKTSNPIKEDHDFLGWYYIKQSGSESNPTYTEIEFDFDTQITNDYSLYAKYYGEAVLMRENKNLAFWKSTYREKITQIDFKKGNIVIPETAIENWDLRADNTCSAVSGYIENDETEEGFYKVTIISPYTIYANPITQDYFKNFTSLKKINFANFNTSKSQNMRGMFFGSIALPSLDLTGFDTSHVTSMRTMFYCGTDNIKPPMELTEILGIETFDTSKVTDMSYMFKGCSNLINLNIESFNTSNVTNMRGMLSACSSIQNVFNFENWNIENVNDFSYMFSICSSPKIILPGTNLKATSVERMFQSCGTTEINISGIKGNNVTNIYAMFYGMTTTPNIIDISSFSFENVTDYRLFINKSGIDDIIYVKDEKAQQFVLEHRSKRLDS